MNRVYLKLGDLAFGFQTNRMPDAGDGIIDSVAGKGSIFRSLVFLLRYGSRYICRLGAFWNQFGILEFFPDELQEICDMLIVLCFAC